jgi:predicted deacylase
MSFCLTAAVDTLVFPSDYSSGREAWLKGLSQQSLHLKHQTYPCPDVLGPNSEQLATDSVWLGSEDASRVLVLIAGTHGIEGFVGSAVEIDHLNLIASGHIKLAPDTAVLMIHALTPWGYAWQRRCDQDGVDLNRNIVDFSKPLPLNPGYDELRPALFSDDQQQRKVVMSEFEKQHGRRAFECAISGGQYTDPTGPFYGGRAPAHGRRVAEDLMQRYALQQRDLAVIDLHSGLGPFGYGEIICDHDPDSSATAVACQWYGESVTLPALGTSSSVPKVGLLDYAWHSIMNQKSCYITLEFGTFRTDQLLEILLRDHQLWSQPDTAQARLTHRKIMRHHFCPDDQAWKEMVLFRARQVCTQAMRGLAA